MEIRSLDGDDPDTIAALLPGFRETMSVELPDDPPVTEALLARLLQRRHGADRLVLAAFDGERIAGSLKLGLDLAEPADTGHGSLWVFPGFRRRGAGRLLIAAAQRELAERDRPRLLLDAPHTPASEGFAGAVGARRTVTNLRNRLRLNEAVRARLDGCAEQKVAGYHLAYWLGRCPDDLVDSYALAWRELDVQVNGQARIQAATAADVRAREDEAVRTGHRQYTAAAVEDGTGAVVAYSTLYVRDSPMADAGEVLVLPEHRRRGLGTWTKAYATAWAAHENEQLFLVQAWNETENDAIVALNGKLGFAADASWSTYELNT
ncbi:GNAT family N-acetyltransferase [Streptomyces sp. H10-C2]|uniref:GNAT family N-acetyltransferase n=1 Tax=unclassified Streptomyces TaxID=2593676 RepID=UPI0024BB44D8|nr:MULTISPECIES: GNAT family N-acetyltransferase [unclassified Streptomyces]MDJ0341866.1 GNAT family N-acetyltransferase [Streptomyces sp. PH10-H1]MDJ0370380.1 GNAT family N-acetyltransferase [Streptomyces sp. H10-C2]